MLLAVTSRFENVPLMTSQVGVYTYMCDGYMPTWDVIRGRFSNKLVTANHT